MPANGYLPNTMLAPIAGGRLRKDAALRWNAMNALIQSKGHPPVLPNGPYSSYRDFAGQVLMRKQWCAQRKCGNAAVPGTSNHGIGLAVDVNRPDLVNKYGAPFGWQKKWSDAAHEPWHFKWSGFGKTDPGLPFYKYALQFDSKGEPVSKLQELLKKHGYWKHGLGNYFGKNVQKAVKKFQKDNGMTPDGIVGTQTWKVLRGPVRRNRNGKR